MSQEHVESVDLVSAESVAYLTASVLIASLTAVLAQLSIPFTSGVPFSLQPFAVFFAGILLGPLWGGFALLVYFAVGIAGVPVFANFGVGLGYVFGPTGGFLIGFIVGTFVLGLVVHRSFEPRPIHHLSTVPIAVGLAIAIGIIYAFGVPWLWLLGGEELSLAAAAASMAPLFVLDFIKAAMVLGLIASGNELIDRF